MYVTLYDVIDKKIQLNQVQFDSLRNFLYKGLRSQQKKQRLAYMTPFSLTLQENKPIFKRLYIYANGEIEYTAYQDYVSELRTLRDHLLAS